MTGADWDRTVPASPFWSCDLIGRSVWEREVAKRHWSTIGKTGVLTCRNKNVNEKESCVHTNTDHKKKTKLQKCHTVQTENVVLTERLLGITEAKLRVYLGCACTAKRFYATVPRSSVSRPHPSPDFWTACAIWSSLLWWRIQQHKLETSQQANPVREVFERVFAVNGALPKREWHEVTREVIQYPRTICKHCLRELPGRVWTSTSVNIETDGPTSPFTPQHLQ